MATDTALLEEIVVSRLHEREFFIRKAIGWALRQYARTDPAWVRSFVARHEGEMSGLSRREAMKHLE
jgi:3-methyladenine DNA glycosylase AlkD